MKKIFCLFFSFMIVAIFVTSCMKKAPVTETVIETSRVKETTAETKKRETTSERPLNPDIRISEYEVDDKTSYDIVRYGKYDMSIGYAGDIEWLVVDKNEKSYLLVSRYILDCKNYNNSDKEVIWSSSTLNDWLNNYFLNSAFSSDEIAYMNAVNEFDLNGSRRVGLLDIASCAKYFGIENAEKQNYKLSAEATTWAISNWEEVVQEKDSKFYHCGSFYLTDNGTTDRKAAWVGQYGHVYIEGQPVKLTHGDGVRPVIVVKKELFDSEYDASNIEKETSVENQEIIIEDEEETSEDERTSETMETTKKVITSNSKYSNVASEKHKSTLVPISEADVVELSAWEYGRTPITWIYVEPNKQIICNNSPNRSTYFSYKVGASSGSKGCYMTIFSKGSCLGSDWDGRFYSIDDYKKTSVEDMLYEGKFEDLRYGDYSIKELLSKKYTIEDVNDCIIKANGTYVNIIYISELEEIISSLN